MGFQRRIPSTVGELRGYLDQVQKNMKHVSSVKVNESNGHLEIDLDRMANFAGYDDMYMPIQRGKLNAAKELVERMMTQARGGFAPSDSDSETLFNLIDQHGR
jgi:hypothetical protein